MREIVVVVILLATAIGCSSVAPYERSKLALPSMSVDDPYATLMADHVAAVSEGGTGGVEGGGGGCGCN